ncbi:hypothetical protein JCM39194_03360 [Desulfotomaculum varum]
MEKLLTSQQAAKLLNVWPHTLRRWEKEGKLKPLHTPGGHRRYDRFIKAKEGFRKLNNWQQWSAVKKSILKYLKKKGVNSLVFWQVHRKKLLGVG